MRRLGTLAITIAGLIVLVGLPGLLFDGVRLIALDERDAGWPAALLALVPVAAGTGLALLLLSKRRALAVRWFDDEPLGATVEPQSVLHALIAFTGAVLLVVSIPVAILGVGAAVAQWIAEAAVVETPFDGPSMVWLDLITPGFGLIYALVGYGLVVKAGPLASRLWQSTSSGVSES